MERSTAVAVALVACACGPDYLAPYGQALVVVDTDAVVPGFVSRLRLDVYTADGSTWYDSRDVSLPDPQDWPASFGLYSPDPNAGRTALVRLRAYRDGVTRSYQGEAFVSRTPTGPLSAPASTPPQGGGPRLIQNGVDVTPPTEPEPRVTIDRLFLVDTAAGVAGKVVIDLSSACFGTMADLANEQTCVDTDAQLAGVTTVTLDPDLTIPPGLPKTYGLPVSCPSGTPLHDGQVCVGGGAFFLGNEALVGQGALSAVPLQVVRVSPFLLDTNEVTVARWRDAVSRGFKPTSSPTANDQAKLEQNTCMYVPPTCEVVAPPNCPYGGWCTYTTVVGSPENREAYPLNCVGWQLGRELCQFEGGDLPTEAQWEYVAQVAGSADATVKRTYPWGEQQPGCYFDTTGAPPVVAALLDVCSGSNAGRERCVETNPAGTCGANAMCPGFAWTCGCHGHDCPSSCSTVTASPPDLELPQGPQRVDFATGDVGYANVDGLYGSLSEVLQDSFDTFDSSCWAASPRTDPVCVDSSQTLHAVRGSSWETAIGTFDSSGQRGHEDVAPSFRDHTTTEIGFRCAYPVTP